MFTFESAAQELKGKLQKKLENNTYLVRVDKDAFGIQLHETVVVYIFRSGIYQYDSGEYRTKTTRDRMNKYGPTKVYQKGSLWYIGDCIYADGVRMDATGKILDALRKPRPTNQFAKAVGEYIKGFHEHAKERGLGSPDADPWKLVDLTAKPLQPRPEDCQGCREEKSVKHLLEHIKNKEYVPSLLWFAMPEHYSRRTVWGAMQRELLQGDSETLLKVLRKYFKDRKPALMKIWVENEPLG
jgi:hypothetical protein